MSHSVVTDCKKKKNWKAAQKVVTDFTMWKKIGRKFRVRGLEQIFPEELQKGTRPAKDRAGMKTEG